MTPAEFLNHAYGVAQALASCDDPHSVEDVLRRLATESNLKLWGNADACIITEQTDSQRAIHFWIATGQLDAVTRLSDEILEWARSTGYERATLIGRRGWVRALRDEGWDESAVVMRKELAGPKSSE